MAADRINYPSIPDDFPVGPMPFSVAGVQAKVNLSEENGQFYPAGTSPSEVAEAFDVCEELAQKFVQYCLDKEEAQFGTRAAILERVHGSLLTKDWCTPAQCGWIVQRTAGLLGWGAPEKSV